MRKQWWRIRIACALVVVFGISGSVAPGSAVAAPIKRDGHPVFILLQGITSSLDPLSIGLGQTPGFVNVQEAVSQIYPNAEFVSYSYNGPTGKGKIKYAPRVYDCFDTTQRTLPEDIASLDDQIQSIVAREPQSPIYLVGHSLGGVIAYGYLGALEETGIVKPLPHHNIAGVITLDSPIGGVSGNADYQQRSIDYLAAACRTVVVASPALVDLANIFASLPTNGDPQPRGGHASVLAASFPDASTIPNPPTPNELIAQDAASQNIDVLTIGNWNDLLWQPGNCGLDVIQFVATQWVRDLGNNSGVYGRTVTQGDAFNCFLDLTLFDANHLFVLSDAGVMQAIQQFIVGQTPSALPPAHGES